MNDPASVAAAPVATRIRDTTGPFNALVDERRAAHISTLHAVYGAALLMALIALHLLVIGYHVLRLFGFQADPPGTGNDRVKTSRCAGVSFAHLFGLESTGLIQVRLVS